MDSLTQIVLGAAVGEAVLGKKVGNKAMLYGAIAGTIPDLDTIWGKFLDPLTAIEIHRGISHSIIFSVVMAPILGWLVAQLHKKAQAGWKDWSWLFFWGLVTHPLLDAHTTWGTQLFWPLDLRLAYQNIFVIDPLYTLPFLIFLILAIRLPKASKKRRKWNNLGLIISSAYMVMTLVLKGISYQKFTEALDREKIEYTQIDTRPAAFNTILWHTNIDVGDAYLLGDYSFFDSQPISFKYVPKDRQLLGDFRNSETIERLDKISNGWYAIEKRDGELYYNDLRFGVYDLDAKDLRFVFSYQLIPEGDGLEIREAERDPEAMKQVLASLWSRIWGN
ncbi:MAG TPA: metal-dependent hydrolase [Leeuwenhoekiella sp.]|nr:metal-dependent hydrolase [Leeuwenhoekiella sp.]HCQ76749.1 metal-dependent hydrolase [Leeuwenhoekiella sp.]|tara:strand:+ start:903 stop:1904 length:1002 start_codon:yes stop_codon:yes gene_type:complete